MNIQTLCTCGVSFFKFLYYGKFLKVHYCFDEKLYELLCIVIIIIIIIIIYIGGCFSDCTLHDCSMCLKYCQ